MVGVEDWRGDPPGDRLRAPTVAPGDVVLIPPGCRQRISNVGNEDLIFLAICTPRFRDEAYEDIDPDPMPLGPAV
jgi:oxalate decarboxylase/phosphoglucose isomerase-like protein (cupin superfamily)